jgi:hypothetical protein
MTKKIEPRTAQRVLIFSLPRSGSSSLLKILNCHPQIECGFEPFNPATKLGKKFRFSIHDEAGLERALAKVWKLYNGIKHVWNSNGLPFEKEGQRLNHHLLEVAGSKVIFLKRHNMLRRIVSGEISRQSGQWSSDVVARRKIRRSNFEPIDIAELQWQLERELTAIEACRDRMIEAQIPFFDLWYEDLFGEWDPVEGCEEKVDQIIEFLGLPLFDARARVRVRRVLDPLRGRVNSPATYERIPNIAEVERTLGADDTGRLFS